MKKNIKSKSKSRGKEKIKVKASQNTEKKQPNTKTPQIKPVSLNKLQDSNRKTSPPQKPQEPPTKEIKDEKPKKIEELFKGADNPQKYDFNLHKHLKENLKFKDKQCKDGLTKESLYCLDCKIALCPKCQTYSTHDKHYLILKYPYYICNDSLINENFIELDKIFESNLDFLDVHKVKDELKKLVNDSCKVLFDKLTQLKESKLKEIESMFAETEKCYETLKQNVNKMKEEIKKFLEKQKNFLCIDFKENKLDSNEIIKSFQDLGKSNYGLVTTSNKDGTNAVFLVTYD